jgi:hypothetical protein
MPRGLNLGAPGIYRSPDRVEFAFAPIRLDIAGFVGLAMRGPVNEPTQVDSWTDYQRAFGGFEAPEEIDAYRLLPYAVEAFFAQGGVRAFIVRVAPTGPHTGPDQEANAATARFQLGPYEFAAANEGSWGNKLRVRVDFDIALSLSAKSDALGLRLPPTADIPAHSLLRLRAAGLPAEGIVRWVDEVVHPAPSGPSIAVLNEEIASGVEFDCAVITGTLRIDDGDETIDRTEGFPNLGLHPHHPRFIYNELTAESVRDSRRRASLLINPLGVWSKPITPGDGLLNPVRATVSALGHDRWNEIDFDSFFDDAADSDPLDEWDRHRGVDAMGRQQDIGLLCVPDLDWEGQGPATVPKDWPPRVRTSGRFEKCTAAAEISAQPRYAPITRLDPTIPDQLEKITRRQQRVVEVANLRRRFIALLDVPNGVPLSTLLRWRAEFDTSFAAAYHPWLGVPREDDRHPKLLDVPPSAFAAGIIAARERRLGLPWGPANELATGAVAAATSVSDAMHDQLHLAGINVFRVERDGFRLSAARTLSSDADYRQLSIRRLMTMLKLTLERQGQWLVFEPNTAALRRDLVFAITQMLRQLQRAGAFAGATDAESYFVRCDDSLNPRQSQELGRLVAEVGVAPAAPLEYLVLRITTDSSGRVQVSTRGGAA